MSRMTALLSLIDMHVDHIDLHLLLPLDEIKFISFCILCVTV